MWLLAHGVSTTSCSRYSPCQKHRSLPPPRVSHGLFRCHSHSLTLCRLVPGSLAAGHTAYALSIRAYGGCDSPAPTHIPGLSREWAWSPAGKAGLSSLAGAFAELVPSADHIPQRTPLHYAADWHPLALNASPPDCQGDSERHIGC